MLIKTYSTEQAAAARPQSAVIKNKIGKFSWGDEDDKVKIYIDTNQFRGTITKEMVSVTFEEYLCDVKVTDEEGTEHIREFYK